MPSRSAAGGAFPSKVGPHHRNQERGPQRKWGREHRSACGAAPSGIARGRQPMAAAHGIGGHRCLVQQYVPLYRPSRSRRNSMIADHPRAPNRSPMGVTIARGALSSAAIAAGAKQVTRGIKWRRQWHRAVRAAGADALHPKRAIVSDHPRRSSAGKTLLTTTDHHETERREAQDGRVGRRFWNRSHIEAKVTGAREREITEQ